GFFESFHMVGQWFPKIAVWEPVPGGGARWNCHAFHANSEFFSDFGDYVVELTTPADEVVGATGVLVEERAAGPGKRTRVYHAEDVHDFAFAADPTFLVAHDRFQDVDLAVYYHRGSEKGLGRELSAVKAALDFFGRVAFPYPYRTFTV